MASLPMDRAHVRCARVMATLCAVHSTSPTSSLSPNVAAGGAAVDTKSAERSLKERHPVAHDKLTKLLGTRYSIDLSDRVSHGRDRHSYHSGPPPYAMCYPLSTQEVSDIVKICASYRIPMIPFGTGTSLEGHTQATTGGICIDVSRMKTIVAIHHADMDVVVQPGLSNEELNNIVKPLGLFYPVDPAPTASIGGMVACSCSGTNAYRYGTMRNNVINVTVVLPDGTIVKTAQRARKTSAGYNLTGLFIGSEGTLGIVTEATLRLQPVPPCTRVASCYFADVHAASNCVLQILSSGVSVACVELLDEVQMKAINTHFSFTLPEKTHVFFKFTGTITAVEDDIIQVGNIVKKFTEGQFKWAANAKEADELWAARKWALLAAKSLRRGAKVWTTDVCVPVSKFADCITQTKADIDASFIPGPLVGHCGDGNFHVFLLVDTNNEREMKEAARLNARMVERAIAMEGTCTGEHGVGVGKRDYLLKELGPNTISLMKTIKRTIDPHNIMNPGKIFRMD